MRKNQGYKKLAQKRLTPQKLSVGVVVVLLLVIFFAPSFKSKKIIEGNETNSVSETIINPNILEDIQVSTAQIVEETNNKNNMQTTSLDIDTIEARLDHTTIENKSNKIQFMLLAAILIIVILSIITINIIL